MGSRTTNRRATVILVVSALAFAGFATPASAVHLACGDTVTGAVVLDDDLSACPSDGLVVGANRTTIDLNGFSLSGTGTGLGINVNGFNKVRITNAKEGSTSTISGFGTGIRVEASRRSKILADVGDVTIASNGDRGIVLRGASRITIRGVSVVSNGSASAGDGISVDDLPSLASKRIKIIENTVTGNADDGIDLDDSKKVRVIGNTSDSNGDGLTSEQDGIELDDVSASIVKGNTVFDNADAGIRVEGDETEDNAVKENIVHSNDEGIALEDEAKATLVKGNNVQDSASHGIHLFDTAKANVIEGNISGLDTTPPMVGNGGHGIFIEAGATRNTVKANTTNGNALDGINAPDGTKGGGNTATGNSGTDCTPTDLC